MMVAPQEVVESLGELIVDRKGKFVAPALLDDRDGVVEDAIPMTPHVPGNPHELLS
jgi:hypothetical protein